MFSLRPPVPYHSPLISAPLPIVSDRLEHPLAQFPLFLCLLFGFHLGFFSFQSDLHQDGSGNLLAHKTCLPDHCHIFPLPLIQSFHCCCCFWGFLWFVWSLPHQRVMNSEFLLCSMFL